MKKIYLYTTLLAAAMTFAACNEDYTDWAAPQSNAQEAQQGAVNGTIAAATDAIDLNAIADGTASVVKFVSAQNATEGSVVKFTKLLLNDSFEVPFTTDGNDLVVSASDLSNALQQCYGSLATTTRECNFKVNADLVNAETTAVLMPIETNEVTIPVKTLTLPAIANEDAYYYVGGYNGWNLSNPTPMTANGDGTYSCVIELAAGSEWFCFAPQSAVTAGDWNSLLRAQKNGDDATSGFFGESAAGNSFCANIEKAGKYKFTISPKDWTYSYASFVESLYYAGDANGWSFSPLVKSGDNFVGYYYVKYADNSNTWGFKFCTDASWDNPQYGAGEGANSIALGGGNIQLAEKDAFYQIVVNTDNNTCYLNEVTSITCVGNHNGWNVADRAQHMTYNVDLKCWELTTTLTNGFKFAINDAWDISWGGANGDPKMYDNLTEFSGKDLDAPEGDGTYLVQLYLGCEGTHKVVLTKK